MLKGSLEKKCYANVNLLMGSVREWLFFLQHFQELELYARSLIVSLKLLSLTSDLMQQVHSVQAHIVFIIFTKHISNYICVLR